MAARVRTDPIATLVESATVLGLVARPLPDRRVEIEGYTFPVVEVGTISDHVARGLDRPDGLYVASHVTETARTILRSRAVGFLDRRGHLSIRRPGLVIESDFSSEHPVPRSRQRPIGGATLDVATWILHRPDLNAVRQISRAISRPPSTVSVGLERLRREGLATGDNEPLLPELFDACVEEWRYRATPPVTVRSTTPQ